MNLCRCIILTRAFRLRMNVLLGSGMLRKAAAECEELLRLCEGDNLGVRHKLMHISGYVFSSQRLLSLGV